MSNLFALLVGIDAYEAPVPRLRGCVNDVTAVADVLRVRVAGGAGALRLRTLVDDRATRAAVVDGFRGHLGQATADDVVLFYYSGHGSQAPAPEVWWDLEPDHLDETLVLFDSRRVGEWDLADKELAALIAEVAHTGAHVLVVLDCCHSGSGTRAALDEGTAVRRAPTDDRPRPVETFLFAPGRAVDLAGTGDRAPLGDSGWALPHGRHVLLSACRSNETAKEVDRTGTHRGALSVALETVLAAAAGTLTYRDVHRAVSAAVRTQVREQHPQLETSNGEDLDRPFLGGAVAAVPGRCVATHGPGGWTVDVGRVQGIPEPPPGAAAGAGEGTLLHLLADDGTVLAQAVVSGVGPGESTIEILPGGVLDTGRAYPAVVVHTGVPPQLVSVSGTEPTVTALRDALAARDDDGTGPGLVRLAADGESAAITVSAGANGYRMSRTGAERALVPSAATAQDAVLVLEHLAEWTRVAALSNRGTGLAADAVSLTLEADPAQGGDLPTEVDGQYRFAYLDETTARRYTVRITNRSNRPLWCALLDLTDTYGIYADALPAGSVRLEPGEQAPVPLSAVVPDELWSQGVSEVTDLLKLVVATLDFDARTLERPDLDVSAPREAPEPAALRSAALESSLDAQLRAVRTRRAQPPDVGTAVADWFTRDVVVTSYRPQPGHAVRDDASVEVVAGVVLDPHPSFRGTVRLSSTPDVTRDLAAPPVPPLLRDDTDAVQPFSLMLTRGAEPDADALLIVPDPGADLTAVTPDQPLVVRVDQALGTDEHVLPIAWDGEFYLPLGFSRADGDGTQIVIERLPGTITTSRSLVGSIRILFRKVVGKRLGLPYRYPLLRGVTVSADGTVAYDDDTASLARAVAGARSVVLYVHGIIGDTEGMTRSGYVSGATPAPRLIGSAYDLVLAFDYENLNTTIEENATLLRDLLRDVGLGEGHGKRFDVVAHSMGGLISRQLIEFVGGVEVTRLITLGTPQAGSRLATLQKWGTAAIALALNGLTSVAWPVAALNALLGAIERVDNSLDEMEEGSPLVAKLASAPDPHVPYVVIVGNRSLTAGVPEDTVGRLLTRLSPQHLLGQAADLAFLRQPNDLAVAVTSARALPAGRVPAPVIHEVGCDHVTFFSTSAGLSELAAAALDGR